MGTWISQRTGQFAYFDAQLGHPDWRGKRVLDFGGNVGNFLLHASPDVDPDDYWSIDVSRDAIEEGRRRHPKAHFLFYDRYNFEYNPTGQHGLAIPDPGVGFDVIIAWSVATHVSKAELLDLVDGLTRLAADGGTIALSFMDPHWAPPEGWARDTEAPGRSNLSWRLDARRQVNPSVDVDTLLAQARDLTWVTLVNDDDLRLDPDDDGWRGARPNTYITFCTPEYMRELFPNARVRPPVRPERHHCLLIPAGRPSQDRGDG